VCAVHGPCRLLLFGGGLPLGSTPCGEVLWGPMAVCAVCGRAVTAAVFFLGGGGGSFGGKHIIIIIMWSSTPLGSTPCGETLWEPLAVCAMCYVWAGGVGCCLGGGSCKGKHIIIIITVGSDWDWGGYEQLHARYTSWARRRSTGTGTEGGGRWVVRRPEDASKEPNLWMQPVSVARRLL